MGPLPLIAPVLAVAAVAAALSIVYAYRRDLRRAHAAVTGAPVAITTAGPIEYAEAGSGLPVLSIHGAGGGWDQGLANVADLFGPEYRVIAPSRFGYLGTPLPADASDAAQGDAHAALLAELGVGRAIVVGASAGARSAIALALRHPDRVTALILIVPATFAPDSPVRVDRSHSSALAFRLVKLGADFTWWAVAKLAPSVWVRFLGVAPSLLDAAAPLDRAAVMAAVRHVQPLSRRMRGIGHDSVPQTERPPLERIRAPTLVVTARDDLFNTLPAARFAAATIPRAEWVVYESGGHLLVGRHTDLRVVLRGFLRRADSVGLHMRGAAAADGP
ncbi:MAG: alpha/beta hydrolase [Rhodanobacter denitrificans]|uniref:Alpha/beta hydrolase n=1 Tax=Rhodanobacter denitrificans TaxID=666685 RepID=A0A2W5KDG7_9GAMM|nr:MAG: alpha/beta hydrolase [Rhodanobacter denitrificans]